MKTIERSTAFKRDYKREAKGRHRAALDTDLIAVLMLLASDKPLEARYREGKSALRSKGKFDVP